MLFETRMTFIGSFKLFFLYKKNYDLGHQTLKRTQKHHLSIIKVVYTS